MIEVGSIVRVVRNHWLRPGCEGAVVEFDGKRINNWLVQFKDVFPGGGFTIEGAEGQYLWFSDEQLKEFR